MKLKRPGLRIIKTFIAVTISMMISYYRSDAGLPFFSAIAAIISLQQDVHETNSTGLNRMIGTVLGGICGLLYLTIVPYGSMPAFLEIILVSFLTSLIIWIMANAGKTKALSIMAIVFLSITINNGGKEVIPWNFAFNRTFDTMIGVVVAVSINWIDFWARDKYHETHPH